MNFLRGLSFWNDDFPRSGFANMAIDEWLLETAREPVLRVYRWEPGWGSLGVFGRLSEARAAFPDPPLRWVRRWTGGGVVDHRSDWTYTLAIPRGNPAATLGGGESYRRIHAALAAALQQVGEDVRMLDCCGEGEAAACFQKPVAFDLVDAAGRKRAGAGQRRNRQGLLHQGSVAPGSADRDALAAALAKALADAVEPIALAPPAEEIRAKIKRRYGSGAWLERR